MFQQMPVSSACLDELDQFSQNKNNTFPKDKVFGRLTLHHFFTCFRNLQGAVVTDEFINSMNSCDSGLHGCTVMTFLLK